MEEQISGEMAKLSLDEQKRVKAVIRILQDNGALPVDNPATALFPK
jgi:hypothetical protein